MGDYIIEFLFFGFNFLCCRYIIRWFLGIGFILGVKILLIMIIIILKISLRDMMIYILFLNYCGMFRKYKVKVSYIIMSYSF